MAGKRYVARHNQKFTNGVIAEDICSRVVYVTSVEVRRLRSSPLRSNISRQQEIRQPPRRPASPVQHGRHLAGILRGEIAAACSPSRRLQRLMPAGVRRKVRGEEMPAHLLRAAASRRLVYAPPGVVRARAVAHAYATARHARLIARVLHIVDAAASVALYVQPDARGLRGEDRDATRPSPSADYVA